MKICVNGTHQDIVDGMTLDQVVARFKLKRQSIAVELNEHIVKRDQFSHTQLHAGDKLEIVHFVGGG